MPSMAAQRRGHGQTAATATGATRRSGPGRAASARRNAPRAAAPPAGAERGGGSGRGGSAGGGGGPFEPRAASEAEADGQRRGRGVEFRAGVVEVVELVPQHLAADCPAIVQRILGADTREPAGVVTADPAEIGLGLRHAAAHIDQRPAHVIPRPEAEPGDAVEVVARRAEVDVRPVPVKAGAGHPAVSARLPPPRSALAGATPPRTQTSVRPMSSPALRPSRAMLSRLSPAVPRSMSALSQSSPAPSTHWPKSQS